MFIRMWHGRVSSEKAVAYRAFLEATAIPDYAGTPGNSAVAGHSISGQVGLERADTPEFGVGLTMQHQRLEL